MSTRDAILGAAETLILQKGVSATSLNDICALAKITKGAFFHYFKSKNDLIIESILRFSQRSLDKYTNLVLSADYDPVGKLKLFFETFETEVVANDLVGCVVGISAQELAVCNSEIQKTIVAAFTPVLDFIAELIEDAAQQQNVRIEAHSLALLWLSCSQGALMLYRGFGDKQIIVSVLADFRNYLFQILKIK